jgi:glycosyltransferase involved in cell wall biosynthesis
MKLAFVKPDYGIAGGFEFVLRRIELELAQRGHSIDWLTVDVAGVPRVPFGVEVPPHVWSGSSEFFTYLTLVDAFRRLDARRYDVMISTQPPSFVVEHPRHLALFSHHLRVFYDLSDVYLAAGFADPELHARAEEGVRQIDAAALGQVEHFLAASEVVQERLSRYNGLSANVGVYHAGIGIPEGVLSAPLTDRFEYPLCVSRHEFPKRTELFVHAMKFLPGTTGVVVGTGGRLPWVRAIDTALSAAGVNLEAFEARDLWLCRPGDGIPVAGEAESNVRFLGHVSDDNLAELYRGASCVVAPAYLEDYGLTAIEAMAFGKPLVVCKDGGGLTEFVEDGINGFVVEPTGPAIAAAVQRFVDEPELSRTLGRHARQRAGQYTWARAMEEITAGLERVAG